MMRRMILGVVAFASTVVAEVGYQTPPRAILDLVDVPRAPSVLMDEAGKHMVLLRRDAFVSIARLSRPESRLGGLRIDPRTNIGSRTTYYNHVSVQEVSGAPKDARNVQGLPACPRLANFTWSPDQTKMAFTHTAEDGVEVWVLDLASARARRLTPARANASLGDVVNWFADGQALLVKMLPADRPPLIDAQRAVPTGPVVSEARGEKARNRTYQDLLKNKTDEVNFERLTRSELRKVFLDGTSELWLGPAMYGDVSFSPDGEYALVTTLKKPFSYLVPYYRFPREVTVRTRAAASVATVLEVPLIEDLPKGFMAVREGRRNLGWRADRPASLVFVEALDGGDPENKVAFRDELKQLEAPFAGKAVSLLKTIQRFSGVSWGAEGVAVAYDYWWDTRNTKTYLFDPSDASIAPRILFDRDRQDAYGDPGAFVTRRNAYGRSVLSARDGHLFLLGEGFTPGGQFPFLDELNLASGKIRRIYRSAYTNRLETLRRYDARKNRLLTRVESATEYPNYFFRDLASGETSQLTFFPNPYESIQGLHKEVITYQRADGVALSGTLYLPAGYDTRRKKKAPMLMWAYPREYKDKSSAGQNTSNPNRFTYPYYGSPIFWAARGYVVLDRAAFPIVGEGDAQPNDTFVEQLVANAKAAIDAVDARGYIDRRRVAVGGHSYGAFMVANLLTHSDLFAAGIARSGAYNRTLTPFGFQSEERDYWEAPEVYNTMSPFMNADKMNAPLLLIHGAADNNSGTYPLQSEHYFNALKGLGATVRLVMLPKESHGYAARESILHMLWEQDQWLEKHVKNAL